MHRPEWLPLAVAPSSPANVCSRAKWHFISAKTMANAASQSMALSWSTVSQELTISTPFSPRHHNRSSTSIINRPKRSEPPPSCSCLALGRVQEIQLQPVPKDTVLHSLEDLTHNRSTPSAGSPGCWCLRRWPPKRGRIQTVFHSSFCWLPVLAWWCESTVTRLLAMLRFVPFRQGWPGGRPGTERCVDHIV